MGSSRIRIGWLVVKKIGQQVLNCP
uniref:Uncharacterized protein n=1 Tax=Rhizophora mucronata TaxID=61149 RepID=A0A2P2P721_RHIMU